MAIIKLIIAVVLSLPQIITPYVQFVFHGGIDSFYESWSETDEYTQDYAVEIEKDPNKDFVILNLTDIQLTSVDLFAQKGENSKKLIEKSIEEAKPDLITLTGDNMSSDIGYIELGKLLDSYNIPWAPVMGNHDGSNGKKLNEAWDSYILTTFNNCLFKFGPEGMGFGNYIINITENGKVIHTLFMLDTHSGADDTPEGIINYGKNGDGTDSAGYDHLWAKQLSWYKWAVNGIKQIEGKTVESSVFMHIPVVEYKTAADLMCNRVEDENGNVKYFVKDEYKDTSFGSLYENPCPPKGNNGFFDMALELGSTKNMIVGHDHINDLSLNYKGIQLSYGLKSGYGEYTNDEKMGASVLTINADGHAKFSHIYYIAE